MKKFLISLIIAGIVSTGLVFADIKYCGIGARLVKDPYNKKVFVKVVFPNSTAAKSGLPEGAEIISINDQKVKKLNIEQVTNLVRGEEGTKVKLQIKYYKEESTIEIPRAPFTFKEPEYDRFEAHWQQVIPVGIKKVPVEELSKTIEMDLSSMQKLGINKIAIITSIMSKIQIMIDSSFGQSGQRARRHLYQVLSTLSSRSLIILQ